MRSPKQAFGAALTCSWHMRTSQSAIATPTQTFATAMTMDLSSEQSVNHKSAIIAGQPREDSSRLKKNSTALEITDLIE
jgi:hypothetical protein